MAIQISATIHVTATKHRKIKQVKNGKKEKDSKIILQHKSSHFIPMKFSELFFRPFDLAMRLQKEELKKQGKVDAEVSEITEEDLIGAFGVTKDHMLHCLMNAITIIDWVLPNISDVLKNMCVLFHNQLIAMVIV